MQHVLPASGAQCKRRVQVAVLGGGSFATAMGTALARKTPDCDVVMLVRKQQVCDDVNERHENADYLPAMALPANLRATTDQHEAIAGAQYAIHAVPVQASSQFLRSIKDILHPETPLICVSKGIEQSSGFLLSDMIPHALGRDQPAVFLSGPSFAKEVWRSTRCLMGVVNILQHASATCSRYPSLCIYAVGLPACLVFHNVEPLKVYYCAAGSSTCKA